MERNSTDNQGEDSSRLQKSASESPPVIKSESLIENGREVGIEHEGSIYRLKITKQGKLILNK